MRGALSETMGSVEVGSKWLRLAGFRRLGEDRKPLGWTEIMIPEPYISMRNEIVHHTVPYYEQIAFRFSLQVKNVIQQISATIISKVLPQSLDAEEGEAALFVRRQYFDHADQMFEMSLSIHPALRYNYTASLFHSAASSRGRGL